MNILVIVGPPILASYLKSSGNIAFLKLRYFKTHDSINFLRVAELSLRLRVFSVLESCLPLCACVRACVSVFF